MNKKEYLNVALKEVNTYIDILLKETVTIATTDRAIKANHRAYTSYVNDLRKRCGKEPLRQV